MNAWGNDKTTGHCPLQLYTLYRRIDISVYILTPSIAVCTQTVMRIRVPGAMVAHPEVRERLRRG
jgi:hypothetical protein